MRYSSSMLVAVIISFLLFLGMSMLVTAPKFKKSTQIEMVSFSKIHDMQAPDVKKIKPVKPPERETVKKPPVAPPLNITDTSTQRPVIEIPKSNIKSNKLDFFAKISPLMPAGNDETTQGNDGDMHTLFQISPIYPQKALVAKIEGWVKVEFTVNELGKVVNAKVIDAKPHRIFDNATLRALQKSKFKPLIVNGKAVSQKAIQVIEFKINN